MAIDMILRSITDAIRRQHWATAAIEFFIVVVGIFVGLQVDDWNQARNDQALEQEYLGRLQADTQSNIDNFRALESVFESKAAFISSLLESPATELLLTEPKEFLQGLDHSLYVALPAVRTATFSELASSGRTSLLQDIELRGELSNFYSEYRLMQEILDEPVGDYKRLIYEVIPGNVHYRWQRNSGDTDLEAIREALARLQADVRFEAAANAEIKYASDLVFWLRDHRSRAENILTIIGQSGRNQ
jgi:hypothetical protein